MRERKRGKERGGEGRNREGEEMKEGGGEGLEGEGDMYPWPLHLTSSCHTPSYTSPFA